VEFDEQSLEERLHDASVGGKCFFGTASHSGCVPS